MSDALYGFDRVSSLTSSVSPPKTRSLSSKEKWLAWFVTLLWPYLLHKLKDRMKHDYDHGQEERKEEDNEEDKREDVTSFLSSFVVSKTTMTSFIRWIASIGFISLSSLDILQKVFFFKS